MFDKIKGFSKNVINKVIMFLIFIWAMIKEPFSGAEAPDTPVMAGLDAIVRANGNIIAYATNVSWDEDFELQGIRTLGYHGDRAFKSLGYTASITIGTFSLHGDVPEALPTPDRNTILTNGLIDFELIDITSGETLYILQQCKCGTKNTAFDSGSLATKNTTWRARNVLELNVS
jgi:hypothetical protein